MLSDSNNPILIWWESSSLQNRTFLANLNGETNLAIKKQKLCWGEQTKEK